MKQEHHIRTAKDLIFQVAQLPSSKALVDNKNKRSNLSSLYRQVMNIGSVFPRPDKNMSLNVAQKLNKKVSRTCPSCVKPDAMKRYIETALKSLERYAETLSVWLGDDSEGTEERHDSVHDMRPTKKQ